jgi:hypothetical protein
MNRRQKLCAQAAISIVAVLGGVAHADVATPVADLGTFGGSTQGAAGCWASRSAPQLSYCLLAYDLPGASGSTTPVRLLGWEWDASELTPGPVAAVDVRLPASALSFGADALGDSAVTVAAVVDNPAFGAINVQLVQSQPLTTSESTANIAAQLADAVSPVDDPLDSVLPELYTNTGQPAIAPSPCPDTSGISACESWDSGNIGSSGLVFGDGWFWQQTHASGGWNVVPGSAS